MSQPTYTNLEAENEWLKQKLYENTLTRDDLAYMLGEQVRRAVAATERALKLERILEMKERRITLLAGDVTKKDGEMKKLEQEYEKVRKHVCTVTRCNRAYLKQIKERDREIKALEQENKLLEQKLAKKEEEVADDKEGGAVAQE
jgi:calcineurin-like phosphoesterase family protein